MILGKIYQQRDALNKIILSVIMMMTRIGNTHVTVFETVTLYSDIK